MAEEFAATPPEVIVVGGELADSGFEVKGVQSSLQNEGSGAGADGCAIAPGDMNSFWAQLDWVEGSLEAKANLLDFYADSLKQAGAKFQEFDQG